MPVAEVTFARSSIRVRMTLAIEGSFVFEDSDVTQMVREMAVRGVTELRLTNPYSVKVPTNCDTLTDAAKQRLDEPLAAYILT